MFLRYGQLPTLLVCTGIQGSTFIYSPNYQFFISDFQFVTNAFAGHKITEQKQKQCKYLVKKLVELSQFEQISVPFRESHGPAIEKDENSMFQLIDHIFAKVSVSCSIAGKSRCLLSQRLSSHAQQVFVSVVEHSTDLKNRDEFAV